MPQDFLFQWENCTSDMPSHMGFGLQNDATVKTLSFRQPTIALSATAGNSFIIDGCTNLTSIAFPNLVSSDQIQFWFTNCTSLTSISFPKLASQTTYNGRTWLITGNPALTTINLPVLIPFGSLSGTEYNFSSNALSQATVDQIIHRFIVAGPLYTLIQLNGGTNSPPSAAGLAEKAILEGAPYFNTILVN